MTSVLIAPYTGKGKGSVQLLMELHLTVTECH